MRESNECSHNCKECGSNCSERKEKQSFLVSSNTGSHIKKVIGIVSGKGGVGKSLVTSLLATSMRKKGYSCAILDADITGPSIPKMFDLQGKAQTDSVGIFPVESKNKVIGIVENMAYFQCPTCHDKHFIFDKNNVDKLAAKYNIGMSAQIPIDPNLATACDNGNIEDYDTDWLREFTQNI